MCSMKTIVILIDRLRVVHTKYSWYMYLFSNQFLIATYTRANIVIFYRHTIIQGLDY